MSAQFTHTHNGYMAHTYTDTQMKMQAHPGTHKQTQAHKGVHRHTHLPGGKRRHAQTQSDTRRHEQNKFGLPSIVNPIHSHYVAMKKSCTEVGGTAFQSNWLVVGQQNIASGWLVGLMSVRVNSLILAQSHLDVS